MAAKQMIAANAGAEGSIVVDKLKHGKGGFGFNAARLTYGDLVAERPKDRASAGGGVGGQDA